MTAILKNVYFDVLDDIVNKCNNTVHRTIKMKPVEVMDDYYVESNGIAFNQDFNKKVLQFKVGDHVRVSKYEKHFPKEYTPNWSGVVFVINKIKSTVTWLYVINDLNAEEIVGSFY